MALEDILPLLVELREATGPTRDSLRAEIDGVADDGLAAHRVFLDSHDRMAVLLFRDRAGRPRLQMLVDSPDSPRLEFLDSSGGVFYPLPE